MPSVAFTSLLLGAFVLVAASRITMVFSKVRAATKRVILPSFIKTHNGNPLTSDSHGEGGFEQMVHIYSSDLKIIKAGTVLIDPGNHGPNLITDETMRHVHGQPVGPGTTIKTFDGEEKIAGGEVNLCFSGPGPKKRYYTETFRHVPHIIDGFDMVLNHDFYVAVYPEKIPGMLMIRGGKSKKVIEEQKRRREEHERRQEENAQRQQAKRKEELRVAEEKRQAEEAAYYHYSSNSSGAYSGSSGSYTGGSNGY